MRPLILAGICLLVIASVAEGSVSARFGRDYFHGDLYDGCGSKPPSANLFGLMVHVRWLPLLDFDFGAEYSSKDFGADCAGRDYAAGLKHFSVSADASLDILPLGLVKFYAGGGLSYDWFTKSGVPDLDGTDSSPGMQVLCGITSTLPGLVNAYIEFRYRWLGGDVNVNTSSAYLGLELG